MPNSQGVITRNIGQVSVELKLEEAAVGVKKEIEFSAMALVSYWATQSINIGKCPHCKGTRCQEGSSVSVCNVCSGNGEVEQLYGSFRTL